MYSFCKARNQSGHKLKSESVYCVVVGLRRWRYYDKNKFWKTSSFQTAGCCILFLSSPITPNFKPIIHTIWNYNYRRGHLPAGISARTSQPRPPPPNIHSYPNPLTKTHGVPPHLETFRMNVNSGIHWLSLMNRLYQIIIAWRNIKRVCNGITTNSPPPPTCCFLPLSSLFQ